MQNPWDEFSKSIAESVPRRESLRLLGAIFAGAVLGPLGLVADRAFGKQNGGRGKKKDPCKDFCKCKNSKRQEKCLAACRACNGDTTRVCGSCGTYACCSGPCCGGVCSSLSSDPNCGACGNDCRKIGKTCCQGSCVNLNRNLYHCGACNHACTEAPPNAYAACVAGQCVYTCADGTLDCDGTCTPVRYDANNCGACGNVCGEDTPYCVEGECVGCPTGLTNCDGVCTYLTYSNAHCGACGNACGGNTPYCVGGTCSNCAGTMCGGVCTDIYWDNANCGACGIVCPWDTSCVGGWCALTEPYDPTGTY